MSKLTNIILKSINYFIITVVIIFAMLMVGVKIFGIQIYTVLSGSMEPTYKVGSLIYVTKVDNEQLKVGDVITFKVTEKVTATHRIAQINNEANEIKIRTKGDANDYLDENFIESKDIIGKPIFTIPYLGYVASFMQTKSGNIISIGISVLLIVVVILIDSFLEEKTKNIIKKGE